MAPYIDILGDKLTEGDSCFVRAEGDSLNSKPFIAKLMRIEPNEEHGGYHVMVKWYYRPEDPGIKGGRKAFHGERELYQSDHRDSVHSETILGRCLVHSLEEYNELEEIRPQDYYSRFSWSVKTETFSPDDVTVYCICQQPENPDKPMTQCDACSCWFHVECMGCSPEYLDSLDCWRCPYCEQAAMAAGRQGHSAAPPAAAAEAAPPGVSRAAGAAGIGAGMGAAPGTPSVSAWGGGAGPSVTAAAAAPASVVQPLAADPLLEALSAQIWQQHLQQQQQQQHDQQQPVFQGGWAAPGRGSVFGL